MEREAKERLERLALLKQKKKAQTNDDEKNASIDDLNVMEATAIPEETVESAISEYAAEEIDDNKRGNSTDPLTAIDIFQLAPKKITWDLERELKPQLDLLDQRTRDAITLLVKDRLINQQQKDNDSNVKNNGLWRVVKEANLE